MNDLLNNLITALRAELEEYGEMLARLDQQQSLVAARAAEQLPDSVAAIQEQTSVLHETRGHRESCRRALARSLNLPEATPFAELLPAIEAECRPLVEALVEENNRLLRRVQQRARQNHLLLTRSVELMQGLLGSLLSAGNGTVYQDDGKVARPGQFGALACNAVA